MKVTTEEVKPKERRFRLTLEASEKELAAVSAILGGLPGTSTAEVSEASALTDPLFEHLFALDLASPSWHALVEITE